MLRLVGAMGTSAVDPLETVELEHPPHQQGLAAMKFCSACHFGGALLKGVTVSMNDSSAPHSPYWLAVQMSWKFMYNWPPFAFQLFSAMVYACPIRGSRFAAM